MVDAAGEVVVSRGFAAEMFFVPHRWPLLKIADGVNAQRLEFRRGRLAQAPDCCDRRLRTGPGSPGDVSLEAGDVVRV